MALPVTEAKGELQWEGHWQSHPHPELSSNPLPWDEDHEAQGQDTYGTLQLTSCVVTPPSLSPLPHLTHSPQVSLFYFFLEQTLEVS